MSDERDAAFSKIMGLSSMPPDDGPDYDRWLFEQTWQAARERCAKIAEAHHEEMHVKRSFGYNNCGTAIAAAIRRGEGV